MLRKIVTIIVFVIVLSVFYGLISQIRDSFFAGGRIDQAQAEVKKLEEENQNLQKQLAQTQTVDFIERNARDKLNLAREGETVVIIPQSTIDLLLNKDKKVDVGVEPNWRGWLRLFM